MQRGGISIDHINKVPARFGPFIMFSLLCLQRRSFSEIVGNRSIIWFCKPGHESLLREEIELNTKGKTTFYEENGWLRVKQPTDVPPFTEPAWGKFCMHNYETYSSQKQTELVEYAEKFASKALREMMKETSLYNQWYVYDSLDQIWLVY